MLAYNRRHDYFTMLVFPLWINRAKTYFVSYIGNQATEPKIYLEMNEQNLTVSWKLSSKVSDSTKQYVVQYKECLPGSGFDWIKVDSKQTTVVFKG